MLLNNVWVGKILYKLLLLLFWNMITFVCVCFCVCVFINEYI